MPVFVDTSAFYAVIDAADNEHHRATEHWAQLIRQREHLVTSNYVVVETMALLGRRLGFQAVQDFQSDVVSLLRVHWVDATLHQQAVTALMAIASRRLSIVDCVSFGVMRELSIQHAFAFDAHFAAHGFECVP